METTNNIYKRVELMADKLQEIYTYNLEDDSQLYQDMEEADELMTDFYLGDEDDSIDAYEEYDKFVEMFNELVQRYYDGEE